MKQSREYITRPRRGNINVGRKPSKEPNPSTVGANCKRLRLEAGWSQGELAQRAGLSRGTIAGLELGYLRSPDLSSVQLLADAFGVDLAIMLNEPGNLSPIEPSIEAFKKSSWATAMNPTRDEYEWLTSLPRPVWGNDAPSGRTIALLLEWYRTTREK